MADGAIRLMLAPLLSAALLLEGAPAPGWSSPVAPADGTPMLVHRADDGLRDVWFGCRSGAGTITFGFLVRQRPPEALMDKEWFLRHRLDEPAPLVATVKSGRASAKQPSVPFAEKGGAGFNLTLRLDHPVVRQVSRTGRIELEAFGERRAPPPVPLTTLRALLDACREP